MSFALYYLVFLGLFSPGPNVIMLTTSGAQHGFRATLPHLFGVVLGVGIIAGIAGIATGIATGMVPGIAKILRVIAAGWILWMAFRLWQSSAAERRGSTRPMRFHEAVLFQWINPKIWAVAFAAISAHPGGLSPLGEAIRLGTAFSGVNLVVCLFWTTTGALLSLLLTQPRAWTIFARIMAVLLGGSAAMVFL